MRPEGGVEAVSGFVWTMSIVGVDGDVIFRSSPRVCMSKDKTWESTHGALLVDLDFSDVHIFTKYCRYRLSRKLDCYDKYTHLVMHIVYILQPGEGLFKFVIISGDAQKSNCAATKAPISLYLEVGYLLVFYSSFCARVLSDATKKSARINFGQYMMVSNCPASSTFDEYDEWVEEMCLIGYVGSGKGSAEILDVWLEFPHRVISRDPFSMAECVAAVGKLKNLR